MEALKEFQLQRMQDLTQLSTTALSALKTRKLSELGSLPASAFYTAAGTLVISQFLLLVFIRRNSRRLVIDTLDTLLATALLLVLLGIILGLPILACYLGVQGSYLMGKSLLETFPVLRAVARPLLAAVGQGGLLDGNTTQSS